MSDLAIVNEVDGNLEDTIIRVTELIKPLGFGILTRIDFDKKIKEKTGNDINPCAILGACNPKLAYSAYLESTDAALLMPCNIVVTQVRPGRIKVESIRLTKMLGILPNLSGRDEIVQLEKSLETAILSL